jgi:pyridoxine/pyridoxamine 5'-phosphate oxidase
MSKLSAQWLPDPLPAEPLQVAEKWLRQAYDEQVQPNPNAMVIATVAPSGQPSARIVLCKDIVLPQGYIVFYTNYESRKGAELAAHPRAAALLHWDVLQRQVRAEGFVVKSPPSESDDYFASRPWQSRLGAWASEQSRPVASMSWWPTATSSSSSCAPLAGASARPRSAPTRAPRTTTRSASTCRGRPTGVATASGSRAWSSGSRASTACTTARAGRAR